MTFAQSLIVYFISPVLGLMIILIIAEIIMSWLVAFGIINLRNPTAAAIYQVINRFVQPIIQPIRSVLPPFGGLDFSPFVAIVALSWFKDFVVDNKLMVMLG